MENPFEVGYREFKRSIYLPQHPNYEISFEEALQKLESVSIDDVKSFYRDHYAFQNFVVVAVGDVDAKLVEDTIQKAFHDLKIKETQPFYDGKALANHPGRQVIPIKGKTGIEVFIGHAVPLNQKSDDYLAVYLGNFVLGGDFSARLLSKVREELSLTYHIHSQFGGMLGDDLEGHWVVDLMAKPESLEKAMQETEKQISLFVQDGITPEELQRKKSTIIGRLKVDWATTEGLATWILRDEQSKLSFDYIDRLPSLVNHLKLEDVNQAIRRYFHPEQLSIVIAGDVEKK